VCLYIVPLRHIVLFALYTLRVCLPCATCEKDNPLPNALFSLFVYRVASFYYLRHTTMAVFSQHLGPDQQLADVLQVCASTLMFALSNV